MEQNRCDDCRCRRVPVIVAASILLEGLLHHLGQLLNKKRKIALFDALEKVKSELMTLGEL